MDYQTIIDRYYPEGSRLRDIYMNHCRSVADFAMEIARRERLDLPWLEAAAMLHDIAIFLTDAPGIECRGSEPYIRHGVLGASLLRSLCPDDASDEERQWYETMARVAERHTGSGISADDILTQRLPLDTAGNYMPQTVTERLVCYADKFYSKSGSPKRKSLEAVKQSMARISNDSLRRFLELHAQFSQHSQYQPID